MEDKQQPQQQVEETFEDYMRNARDEFVMAVKNEERSNFLLTAIDSFLICFDQMRDRLASPLPASSSIEGQKPFATLEEINAKAKEWANAEATCDNDLLPCEVSFLAGAVWYATLAPKNIIDGFKHQYIAVNPHDKKLVEGYYYDANKTTFQLIQAPIISKEDELKELRAWKESAMRVMPDFQAIGEELGLKLGDTVHDKILPAIINYKKQLGITD